MAPWIKTGSGVLIQGGAATASDWWGALNAGAANLRAENQAGTVQFPRDLPWVDIAGEAGEVHVEIDSVLAASGADLRLWAGGSGTAPAEGDTYGMNAVWANGYTTVHHYNEADPGTDTIDNAQGNSLGDCTDVGTMTTADAVAGVFGDGSNPSAYVLDATDDGIVPSTTSGTTYPFEVTILFKAGTASTLWSYANPSVGTDYLRCVINNGTPRAEARSGGTTNKSQGTANLIDSNWHVVVCRFHSTTSRTLYIDGVAETEDTNSTVPTLTGAKHVVGYLADSTPAGYTDATVDEVRFRAGASATARSAAWYKAVSANLLTPASFYTVSGFGTGSGPDSTTHYCDIHIEESNIDSNLTDIPVTIRMSDIA